jgi:ATP-binding cassette, subfamily C, bacteriocin exporter
MVDVKAIRKSYVKQQDQSDCGVACMVSLVRFFGGDCSLESLREASGTNKQGTTLLGLYQTAQVIGLQAEPLEATETTQLKSLNSPAILHVVLEEKRQHYVIYHGFLNGKYILLDPDKGLVFMELAELDLLWKSKALLSLYPNESFELKSTQNSQKKKWIIDMVHEDVPVFGASIVLGIMVTVLGLTTSIFSQKLIDEILPERQTEKLVVGMVLVGVLLLGRSLIGYVRGRLLVKQSKDFNLRMISGFYGSLLRLPKSFFDSRKTGDMVARMNDTRRIQQAVSSLVSEIVVEVLLVIVTLMAVYLYSYPIGLLVSVVLPFYFVLVYHFHKPISSHQQSVMKSYSLTESHYIDTLQGVGSIKALNKEVNYEKLNGNIYGYFQEQVFKLGNLGIRFGLVSNLLGIVFIISVLAYSSHLVLLTELQIGEMVAILGFSGMIIPAVGKLAMANIQLQEAKIAFDRMYEFVSAKPEPINAVHPVPEYIQNLDVKNIDFRFPGRKALLKGINLSIEKGKLITILGESGGGKSTLLQILMKFYDAGSGNIFINGSLKLGDLNTGDWRRSIGYVAQETKIFNGTLLENICLDDINTHGDAVKGFCKEIGMGNFFESMPQGYMTLVGEEGINLSGGQKQLVALARALYHQPKILLLDEFTGAMDRNTENMMLELLQKLKAIMPMLLVTHKIRPALQSDFVYILENGVILDKGLPSELLQKDNLLSLAYRDTMVL